jgi:hypothetical protein
MAALDKDRNTPLREGADIIVPVAAGVKIYAGALVAANAAGYAVPGSTATTLTYLGRAEESVDNTGGDSGSRLICIRRARAFRWDNDSAAPVAQAGLGKPAYITDDHTVSGTSTGRSPAGIVIDITPDGVWVI